MRTANSVVNHVGQEVSLGQSLGKGGEGEVFEVIGQPAIVAKLYHSPPAPQHAAKLSAMARLKTAEITRFACWPQDLLYQAGSRVIRGITMPRAANARAIHELYSPAQRKLHFPKADYRFLVRTARNCATAFDTLHSAGIIIGDVNQGNLLVNEKALVTFIDCDSFQIKDGTQIHRCTVGVPHYTPPELQAVKLGSLDRTVEHDAFGLAVLLFHLLFLGRHPFAGRYQGAGDMPIEKAIAEYRFAYGRSASAVLMQPPPHSLALMDAGPEISTLFESAFARGTRRPSPRAWLDALCRLEKDVVACAEDPGHYFYRPLGKCPFCKVANSGGPNFFVSVTVQAILQSGQLPNIDATWKDIQSVLAPRQVVPAPTIPKVVRPKVEPPVTSEPSRKWLIRVLTVCTAFWGSATLFLLSNPPALMLAIVAGIVFGLWLRHERNNDPVRKVYREYRTRLVNAKTRLQLAMSRYRNVMLAHDARFEERKKSLQQTKKRVDALPQEKNSELVKLQQSLRVRQLERFLESHLLEAARIPGVGPSRLDALQSYGIESAADVNEAAVSNVPGFGPMLTERVLSWRRSVESQFVFNVASGLPKSDLLDIELKYAKFQIQGGRALSQGLAELRQITASAKRESLTALEEVQSAAHAVADAEALMASLR